MRGSSYAAYIRRLKCVETLGCDEGFLSLPAEFIRKPKGMHWRTFERKIEQLKRVDAHALDEARVLLGSIERSTNRALSALARC